MVGTKISECKVDKDDGTLRAGTMKFVRRKWGERGKSDDRILGRGRRGGGGDKRQKEGGRARTISY
jgi:hypothetical protein